MLQVQKAPILKAADYTEELAEGDQSAKSFLLAVDTVGGYVFGVIQVMGGITTLEPFAAIVEHHLQRLSQTIDTDTSITHRFEQLLQAVNEEIAEAAANHTLRLAISDASAIIGVADKDMIVVSGFGNLIAQFLHKGEKERYEIYDLARGLHVDEEKPTWTKAFLTVLDGELKPGDVLFVSLRINRNDLSVSTLNEILTTLPPSGALGKIRQYLPPETLFSAVVLKNERADEPLMISNETAQASLTTLGRTTNQTDKLLSEQKPELRTMLLTLWQTLFPKSSSGDRRKFLRRLGRFFLRLLIVIGTVAGKIILGAITALIRLVRRLAANPKETLASIKRVKDRGDMAARAIIGKFNHLPKQSKYILLGLCTVAFLFIAGLGIVHGQQTKKAARQAYAQSVLTIEKKIDNAEASLIYGDENQARMLLSDADNLINQLPNKSTAEKNQVQTLKKEISAKFDQLRHAVSVGTIDIADASSAGFTPSQIVSFNNTLYTVADNGDAYKLDGGAFTKQEVTKGDVSGPKAITVGETGVYWLGSTAGTLARYSPSKNDTSALTFSREGVDLTVYGGKLYLLSPATGQVYKHLATASGFDGGTGWIISGVSSLTDATSITIDGYIWILKGDGTLLRYLAGKETDWKTPAIEPSLTGSTDIWTDDGLKYLYVMDPKNKRIVVIDKDKQSLVTQYENDAFGDLKSMIVDEAGKKITVLAGTKVMQFEMK